MKIGVLTYHSPYNFGANLQVYATANYLKSMGHEAKVIDYERLNENAIYFKKVPKEQWSGHDKFIKEKLPLTKRVNSKKELKDLIREEQFEGIIVGADAVWSYPIRYDEMPVYFLDWLFETPDIAYIPAATMSVCNMSGGYKHLSSDKITKLKEIIPKFSILTVRDNWTKEIINKHIFNGQEIVKTINPDPVIIIEDYIKENHNRKGLIENDEKYIICSFPHSHISLQLIKWFNLFKVSANNRGYKVGELPLPEGRSNLNYDFTIQYPIDPIQWYLWIKNSSGFIGLRFHAVVSCISACVPFFSIDSYGSSSLFVKGINLVGLYKLGRAFDKRSKIFQLLNNTKFVNNRVHGLRGLMAIKPMKVLDILLKTNYYGISNLKNELKIKYKLNLDSILDVFKKSI